MARWHSTCLAGALPMTYAYDALARVSAGGRSRAGWSSTSLVLGATLLALLLGAATLRRRTP